MNKLFSKIAALSVGLTMAIGVGVAVGSKEAKVAKAGSETSWTASSQGFSDQQQLAGNSYNFVDSSVSVTFNTMTGTNGHKYYNSGSAVRSYGGESFTISCSTGNLTSITLSNTQTKEVTADVGTYSSNSWTGSAASVTFTVASGSGNFRTSTITAVFEGSGPSVTYTITYDANGGSGTMADSTNTVSACTFTAPEGKRFASWNTAADGLGTSYAPGVTAPSDLDLFAIWEDKPEEITLDSSNWPVSATSTHTNVQESTLDGIVYQNVGGYKYSNQLSLNYAVNNYFANKTAFKRNIKKIVVTYSANVTSYVKMYESSEPATKTTLVSSSGTTTVTYTFSDTTPYFRLNMDTSTPKGTYCNISSIVITLGSAADMVDLEDISLNGDKSLPAGITFASQLTLDPANANNKDTISWNSSNTSVATVDSKGVVTTIAAGQSTITATATDLVGVSSSYVVTVFEANPIEKIYYMESGAALDFNAVYVGFITNSGPVVMNGEYGILLYKSSMDVSSYTAGETILHVTGTLSIYSGLYEVNNPSVEVLESASDVSEPVTYSVTGSETYIHESRRTYVSGTVVSVSGGWTSDTTVVMDVNGHQIQCFAKGGSITDESVQQQIVADASVTLKGFSGWHNGFQVTIVGIVEAVDTYTAEDFAQDLLDSTDAVCVNYVDGESSYSEFRSEFQSIWNNLSSADKYQSLLPEQKSILAEAARDESGTVIEQAMARYDFLTGKYELDNFITGRTPVQFAHVGFGLNDVASDNNTMIIVVVIAAVSALAFTTLLVFKKKKQK